jgi:O-antigen/teichoic acid export membrane protein
MNSLVPVLLLPVLTRYLSPAEYGQVAVFQSIYVVLGAFVSLEVVGAATRKYFERGTDSVVLAGFVTSCLQIMLLAGVVLLILIVAVATEVASALSVPASWLFAALAYASSTAVIQLRLGQWQAKGDALRYGLMQAVQASINCSLSVLLVVELGAGADGRVSAMVLAALIPAAAAIYLLRRDGLLDVRAAGKAARSEAVGFGLPLIPHTIGALLLTVVDRVVIANELGLERAGLYTVAAQVSLGLGLVFTAVNNAYAPWLFGKLSDSNDCDRVDIIRKTYGAFVVILVMVLVVWLAGPTLVLLLAGSQYADAAGLIGWMALGQGFVGMYFAVVNYLFFEKRTATISTCSIITGVLGVALLVGMVRYAGLDGAAIAFAVSMGIRFFVVWWAAQRCHPMPWFSLFRLKDSHV